MGEWAGSRKMQACRRAIVRVKNPSRANHSGGMHARRVTCDDHVGAESASEQSERYIASNQFRQLSRPTLPPGAADGRVVQPQAIEQL